jgi:hypothetical protein
MRSEANKYRIRQHVNKKEMISKRTGAEEEEREKRRAKRI